MHRSIRIAALALPLALAMTWGAAAANATVSMGPDAPAPVPWAPFEQPEADPSGPAAPVPWAPFEQDDGTDPDPDLPEGQPEPGGDVVPEPEPDADTVDQGAPAVEPRTVTPGTPKPTVATVGETASSGGTRAIDSPFIVVLLTAGYLLAGLAVAAGVVALVLWRRQALRRS